MIPVEAVAIADSLSISERINRGLLRMAIGLAAGMLYFFLAISLTFLRQSNR